jgi:O-methyltransferase involved in polyketide biosynthesis
MSIEKSKSQELGHERIAPTALGVAYRRALAELPYAQEVFSVLEQIADKDQLNQLKSPQLAPIIEARYRIVSKLARESGAKQFLEIAAGFSSRGLEFTQERGVQYVEFDLPKVMAQKEKIVDVLEGRWNNFFFASGNALDLDALSSAVEPFNPTERLTIMNEGLMRYLTFDEKAGLARNVHTILENFDGEWITPDITLKSVVAMENKQSPGQKQALSAATGGMDVDANAFEDVEHAESFFEDLGFKVKKHPFVEVRDELVTPAKLGISEEETEEQLRDAVAFVMTLA